MNRWRMFGRIDETPILKTFHFERRDDKIESALVYLSGFVDPPGQDETCALLGISPRHYRAARALWQCKGNRAFGVDLLDFRRRLIGGCSEDGALARLQQMATLCEVWAARICEQTDPQFPCETKQDAQPIGAPIPPRDPQAYNVVGLAGGGPDNQGE